MNGICLLFWSQKKFHDFSQNSKEIIEIQILPTYTYTKSNSKTFSAIFRDTVNFSYDTKIVRNLVTITVLHCCLLYSGQKKIVLVCVGKSFLSF